MMKKWLGMLALLTISLAPSMNAQSAWNSTEEFRAEYMRFLDALSQRVPSSDESTWAVDWRRKISDIRQQVNGLPYPTLDQFSKITDRQAFTKMVDGLAAGDSFTRSEKSPGPPRVGAAIVPPDFSGAVAGTTCSTSPTSAVDIDAEMTGLVVARVAATVAEAACASLVVIAGVGTNVPFCVAYGIARAVEEAVDTLIDRQESCNALLDRAKADATLGDVINVHSDVGALAALFASLTGQISEATALLRAQLKQVMKLQLTPEGRRQIVPAILTCTGANCPNVLASCPAAGCSWNNVGPLP